MHICMADWPPSQLSIDALNTATPNLAYLADIAQCTYMHGRLTPQSIEHRCLEYCYTKLGRSRRYSTMQYMHGRSTPQSIKHRCLEYCYTKLGRSCRYSTYIHGRLTPPSIEHRCLEYCYTKLADLADITQCTYMQGRSIPIGQSSIDALNTASPNLAYLADIAQCTDMHGRLTPQVNQAYMPWIPLHQTREIYPRELLHTKDLLPMRVTI